MYYRPDPFHLMPKNMKPKATKPALKGAKLYAAARRIAELAHRGQRRKGADKRPYIAHCQDVVDLMPEGDWTLRAVAILHDAIEDTTKKPTRGSAVHLRSHGAYRVTAETLREDGIPEDVIAGVEAMTKPKGANYLRYVRTKVLPNDLARKVKIADNYVNLRDRLRALIGGDLSKADRKHALGKVRDYLGSLRLLVK